MRQLKCIRCKRHPADPVRGHLICRHCRLLMLYHVFNQPISTNLIQAAKDAARPWNAQSLRSLFEVMYAMQKRTGQRLDAWVEGTYEAFSMPLPDPPLRHRGLPDMNLPRLKGAMNPETAKLMKQVQKRVKAIRAAQEEAGQ